MGLIFDKGIEEALRLCVNEYDRGRVANELVENVAMRELFFGYVLGLKARVAELEDKGHFRQAQLDDERNENGILRATIGKLESRIMQMLNAMAELETRITGWATHGGSPYESVDRDELMLWAVMLNNAMHVKPDRIRELAIAAVSRGGPLENPPEPLWELKEEVERVLKEQMYKGAVERDLKLYGEVTDGTMFANPPPPKEKP